MRVHAVQALLRRGERLGLDGVLAHLDREATPCHVPGDAAGDGYTWEPRDRDDPAWVPQGVAATRGGAVLLVAWYARRSGPLHRGGSRVTVVDRRDPTHVRYRHVLLVRPRRWGRALVGPGRVAVHAGGLAVVGDLLYVADTVVGIRVFSLDDILLLPDRRRSARRLSVGASPGHPTGDPGTRYVLPERTRLRQRLFAAPLRWSFLGTGRLHGELSLVGGEYGRRGTRPRLVRYRLDESTGLPVPDAGRLSRPVEVHPEQPHRMQGVAFHEDTWVITASAGEGNPGDLYVGEPGSLRRHRGVLPTGPEDVDWSVPGVEAWCVTEWPGRRWLFPIDVTRWSPPAGTAAGDSAAAPRVGT